MSQDGARRCGGPARLGRGHRPLPPQDDPVERGEGGEDCEDVVGGAPVSSRLQDERRAVEGGELGDADEPDNDALRQRDFPQGKPLLDEHGAGGVSHRKADAEGDACQEEEEEAGREPVQQRQDGSQDERSDDHLERTKAGEQEARGERHQDVAHTHR